MIQRRLAQEHSIIQCTVVCGANATTAIVRKELFPHGTEWEKKIVGRKRRAAPPAMLYVRILLNKLKEVTLKTILERCQRITFKALLTYVCT